MELKKDNWTQNDYTEFKKYLLSLSDEGYKEFNSRIIPDTPNAYGIRMGEIRHIAKEIGKGNAISFIECKKGNFHEELIIEGIVAANIKCEYSKMLALMKYFSQKIYNWAICDSVSFKGLKKHRQEFLRDIDWFVYNQNPWVQRFGFLCLMQFYLDDEYIDTVFEYVNSINSDFYYVQMIQAWLIATAAAKCRDKTMAFLADNSLNDFTQNKAIQKMRESFRISKEDKEYILRFKRKK